MIFLALAGERSECVLFHLVVFMSSGPELQGMNISRL